MAEVDGLFKRAEEAFTKKNYDYARDLLLSLLARDPNHEMAHKSLFAVCLKKAQEQGGKSKVTTFLFKQKIELLLGTTKDPARKMELSQKHLCEHPNDSGVRTVLAAALAEMGHTAGAAAEAEVAWTTGKNAEALKILVACLIQIDKVDEAQKFLEQGASVISGDRDITKLERDLAAKMTMKKGFEDAENYRDVIKNKDQASLLEVAGHSIQTAEQFDTVIQSLKEQMNANPTDARVPKKIGDLYFDRKKDYPEAREWYKKAGALAPQDTVLRDKIDDCSIRLLDGQVEAAQKAGPDAVRQAKTERLKFVIQSFERRVQDRPTDMTLRYELGTSYFMAGPNFLDKAISEFQQAVKDPKKKQHSLIYLGHCFRKKKNFTMADGMYQKAEEAGILAQPTQLEIWYNRALCNHEAGKNDIAMDLANKIIAIDINYRDISALLEKWQNGG